MNLFLVLMYISVIYALYVIRNITAVSQSEKGTKETTSKRWIGIPNSLERFLRMLDKHERLFTISAIFLPLFGFVLCVFYYSGSELSSLWVIFLFAIPLVLQTLVIVFLKESVLRGFYSVFTLPSYSYLVFWFLYTEQVWKTALSYACVSTSIVLITVTLFVANIIMKSQIEFTNKVGNNVRSLTNAIKNNPFWTVCFFLGVFLCITYLLSFASAFHDKAHGAALKPSFDTSALEMVDYVYFTIYTISTTGYGDIIPVTGYAKFIVSLTSLFEVFFLVIFFNILLSIGRREKRVQDTEAIPDRDLKTELDKS
jgi:hypothetical protein